MGAVELRPGTIVHHAVLGIDTAHPLQIVDITPLVAAALGRSGLWEGVVTVQTRHTTTGVLLNEDEPLLSADLRAMLERLAPSGVAYAHDDFARRAALEPDERINGAAHCRAALLRASEHLAVSGGALMLGRWQRVLFVECDGGQRRQVLVTCVGIARDRPPGPG
jgi:secondary thiamine-phosphate synthase enzyme